MNTKATLSFVVLSLLSACSVVYNKDHTSGIQPMYFPVSNYMNVGCEDLFGFAYNADLEVERIKELLPSGIKLRPPMSVEAATIMQMRSLTPEQIAQYRHLISERMGQAIAARGAYEEKGCHLDQSSNVIDEQEQLVDMRKTICAAAPTSQEIARLENTEMVIQGRWIGEAYGTNIGNFFMDLEGEDSNLTGELNFHEQGVGLAVYSVNGVLDGSNLKLVGVPEAESDDLILGQLVISAMLNTDGGVEGEWNTSVATRGGFKMAKCITLFPPLRN